MLLSCFGEQARQNMQAENLVLNECDYVIRTLNVKLAEPVPDSLFVNTCGCISGILRDELVSYDIARLERDPKKRKEVLSNELLSHLEEIRRECIENRD